MSPKSRWSYSVTSDSDHGLGAALIQEEKPIAFTSRALKNAERNYAQNEKELLVIAYGTERLKSFHQYTYGRPVIVESDHKPLEVIHQKPLSAAPRLPCEQSLLDILARRRKEKRLCRNHVFTYLRMRDGCPDTI